MKKPSRYGLLIAVVVALIAAWHGFSGSNPVLPPPPAAEEKNLPPQKPAAISQQERAARDESARSLAAGFEVFLGDWKVSKMSIEGDPATERALVYARKLKSFDPIQQSVFASKILEELDSSQEGFFDKLALYIGAVSMCNPGAGVLLLKQPPQDFKNPEKAVGLTELQGAYSTALTTLATRDPAGALQWIVENKIQFSEFVREDTRRWMIIYSGKTNPELGIRIAYEWFCDVPSHPLILITMGIADNGQRAAVFKAARECSEKCYPGKSDQHPLDELVGLLSKGVVAEGFAPAMRWIQDARLTTAEINSFSASLASAKPGDALEWIDWVAKKVSPQRAESGIFQVVSNWSEADPKAVAKWLENYPKGNLKNWAISAFVWQVVERDPQTAATWVAKLPLGDLRKDAIGTVYRKWPKSDPGGAADFATKHHIKK